MPARHTKEPHLALLLPLAISQGWSARKFAATAQIDTNEANRLLRDASRRAMAAIGEIQSVDALSLTVKLGNEDVTLGKIQGRMVSGAVRSLGRLPADPDHWDESNDKTYRRCHLILRDAKALGLIRFADGDKPVSLPEIRAADPFLTQSKPSKATKSEKSPADKGTVNDVADSSPPGPAPEKPVQDKHGDA